MAALIVGGIALLLGIVLVVVLVVAVDEAAKDIEERDIEIAEDAGEAECLTSDAGFMVAEVEVTNNSSEPSTYFIEVVFEDPATGDQLESASSSTANLRPDQSTTLEVLTLTEPPTSGFTCEVADVNRFASDP